MARLLQSLRRVLGLTKPPAPKFSRSIDTDFSVFREGDRVVLLGKSPQLTKPLKSGYKTDTRLGALDHDHIIGRRVRDLVKTNKGTGYRITHPTLDDYVSMTPRLVTPIYAADANLVVSLLDLHVGPPGENEGQAPLEILESGTGHGSLTLHLARALQGANSRPPVLPNKSQVQLLEGRPIRPGSDSEEKTRGKEFGDGKNSESDVDQQQWDAWRARRSAVIHTVDISPKFSFHAEKIVRGFRRGIYAGNVDFYVGHIENWVTEQKKRRASKGLLSVGAGKVDPFLSCAILDMPSAHMNIPLVAPMLKTNGVLAVFMPSITQIGDCVTLIRQQRLPFVMESVIELGMGLSNGRLWDVRVAFKKSRADPSSWTESSGSVEPVSQRDEELPEDKNAEAATAPGEAQKASDSVLICRPKVGMRLVGGGFVGIWRRMDEFQDH